jgi:hypothetical protein
MRWNSGFIGSSSIPSGFGTLANIPKLAVTLRTHLVPAGGAVAQAVLLSLGTGTGGQSNQNTYTVSASGLPENGLVVVSSANTYNNNGYYYMANLFTGVNNLDDPLQYWLTSSTGNQTLTFNFTPTSLTTLEKMIVYPRSRTDASSNYTMQISTNNSTWENLSDVNGLISVTNSTSTPLGTQRIHEFAPAVDLTTYPYVRFTLTRNGSWGVTLNEIEVYAK